MKKRAFLALVLLVALSGCETLSSQDGEIRIYQSLPIIPHGSDTYRYEIRGKSYSGVNLEYLRIPEKHIVVFQTDTLLDGLQLHVVPTSPGIEEFKVKIVVSSPGAFPLGLGRPATDVTSTLVESIQGDIICFVTTMYSYKGKVWRTYLDLKNHALSETKPS
jgi:hypothetical protein